MSLSKDQDRYHWRLWGRVAKARPGTERKAMYRALGLPDSHTAWDDGDMDEWVKACLAIVGPTNLQRQIALAGGDAERHRWTIGYLLAALGCGEEYAEAIVARMHRHRRHGAAQGISGATLGSLPPAGAKAVLIALKKECKRRLPTKGEVLAAIETLCRETAFDEAAASAAVLTALSAKTLPPLAEMDYDALIVVFGALRRLAAEPAPAPAAEAAVDDSIPF